MLEPIRRFLSDLFAGDSGAATFSTDDPEVATAALMVHVVALDGTITEVERGRLETALMERYGLDEEDTVALVAVARERELASPDMAEFTEILKRQLDPAGRRGVLAVLWEMALADGELREIEDDALWRIARLLDLSPEEHEIIRTQTHERMFLARL